MLRFTVALAAIVVTALMMLASFFVAGQSLSYGLDVSVPVSVSEFSCLAQQGMQYVIVRAYQSFGQADPNAPATLAAAAQAGFQYRDVYLFPCPYGVSPTQMISQMLATTPSSSFGTVWLDIESNPSSGCGWSSDTSSNCQLLQQLISAAQSAGLTVGIYSSVGEWGTVMGSCTAGADAGLPIWYARYNGIQDYSDWIPFGGWSASDIAMHQYADSIGGLCGVSADANAAQGGSPNPPPPPPPSPPSGSSGSVGPAPPPPSGSGSGATGCMQFWAGLCPGSSSCQCTTGAQCLSKEAAKNLTIDHFRNKEGNCAGSCFIVDYDMCTGSSECLYSTGQAC